jgi:hypothetical protein
MDTAPDKIPPKWMLDSLERSEAEIEAGNTVPLEPVLGRLRDSIDRMQVKKAEPSLHGTA